MRIVVLPGILLVLGCILFWPMEKPEIPVDKERNALIINLGEDILKFIAAGKLSEEDKKTAHHIFISLILDLPLKTIEEMKKEDRREKEWPGTTGKKFKEVLKKRITEDLVSMNSENSPLPSVTLDLAYDLDRLGLLKEVLENAKLESESLDVLFDRAIVRLFLQTEA